MPTGWRPADVVQKYPIYKIDDVYHFDKYDTRNTKELLAWTWIQVIMLLLFVSYLFGNIAKIGSPNMFIYGAFIFVFVYALAEMMDGSRYALVWELIKNIAGILLIYWLGDWFGASANGTQINYILIGYFLLSSALTARFVLKTGSKREVPVSR
jgi:hypothetical protein